MSEQNQTEQPKTKLPRHARVVIIGGGIVGVSALYHLAKLGWTDCVLLEKNELTAGSTWHAAGNCPNFSNSWAVMNMQRYGLELYRGLAEEVDYPMNYHVTGAIRLAHTKERMGEFERVAGMGRYQGLTLDICTPEELKAHNPFIETHDLAGGLWDPLDGDIDPAQATQALAKGARQMGQKIVRFCPVTGISRSGEGWTVHSELGDVTCEYVVNAAGYYAQRVGEWFKPFGGRTVPMVTMSHQYFLTGEIPELEAWTKEHGRKMPMVRDVDISYYLRQDKHGLNLGPYERNCKAHWVTPDDPMPDDFSFQLYPDDLERLEFYIEDAMERMPILGTQGVERVINGPIPYAPDGLPMIGPMPGVKNAFEAHSFTFGIAQGGGAGKVLSEWIVHGQPDWDMWAVDPRRYTAHADHDFCHAKALETYGHEYAMHFPRHEWPAGRDKKLSPVDDRVRALGGVMGAINGWERANWYAKDGDDTSEAATETWHRGGPWEPRVREECEAVRDAAGILDLPGFSRFLLTGDGCAEWLATQITGRVPKVGRLGLAYFADEKGRVVTEMSMARMEDDAILLITAAPAQWHDFAWLANRLPEGLELTDRTDEFDTFILTGPKSRDVLAAACPAADLQSPWLTWQKVELAGHSVILFRVSFAGELGWEIHSLVSDSADVWDAVWEAGQPHGLKPFGIFALNSLRIEKGYRHWKGDLSTDYTIVGSGLDRFVHWGKESFTGKQAMELEKQRGAERAFVALELSGRAPDEGIDAPYMACVYDGDAIVGEVTSAAYGYRSGKDLALASVNAPSAAEGRGLEIDIFGNRVPATVLGTTSAWDAGNERIRA